MIEVYSHLHIGNNLPWLHMQNAIYLVRPLSIAIGSWDKLAAPNLYDLV